MRNLALIAALVGSVFASSAWAISVAHVSPHVSVASHPTMYARPATVTARPATPAPAPRPAPVVTEPAHVTAARQSAATPFMFPARPVTPVASQPTCDKQKNKDCK